MACVAGLHCTPNTLPGLPQGQARTKRGEGWQRQRPTRGGRCGHHVRREARARQEPQGERSCWAYLATLRAPIAFHRLFAVWSRSNVGSRDGGGAANSQCIVRLPARRRGVRRCGKGWRRRRHPVRPSARTWIRRCVRHASQPWRGDTRAPIGAAHPPAAPAARAASVCWRKTLRTA
jgi:hypothetical protein